MSSACWPIPRSPQAGYVLVAIAAGGQLAAAAALFYLLGYAFTNLGGVCRRGRLAAQGRGGHRLCEPGGPGLSRPWMAAALSLCLLSLTGIPFTAGFVGKFYLFGAAVEAGWAWLAIVAVLNSVVSAFYYLHLVVLIVHARPGGCRA
jgi:NADH-quinone oxidoreductase subunit N